MPVLFSLLLSLRSFFGVRADLQAKILALPSHHSKRTENRAFLAEGDSHKGAGSHVQDTSVAIRISLVGPKLLISKSYRRVVVESTGFPGLMR